VRWSITFWLLSLTVTAFWLITFLPYITQKPFTYLIPVLFRCPWPWFSPYCLVYQTISFHLRLLLAFPPLTCTVPPYIVHILPLYEFYSLLLCHMGKFVHLLPPLDYVYKYFFILSGRSRSTIRNRIIKFFLSPLSHYYP